MHTLVPCPNSFTMIRNQSTPVHYTLHLHLQLQINTLQKSALFSSFYAITQSKSKTILTRSMLMISLIVFTDKFQGHIHTFYSKWYYITF